MSSGSIREDYLLRRRRREEISKMLKDIEKTIDNFRTSIYANELRIIKKEFEDLRKKAEEFTYTSEEGVEFVKKAREEITREIKKLHHLERFAEEIKERIGTAKIELKPLKEKKIRFEWKIEIQNEENKEEILRNWLWKTKIINIKHFLSAEEMEELKKTKDFINLQRKIVEYSTEIEQLKERAQWLLEEYQDSSILRKNIMRIKEALRERKFLQLRELMNSIEEKLKDVNFKKTLQLEKEMKRELANYEFSYYEEERKIIIYGDGTRAEVMVGETIEIEAPTATDKFCEKMRVFSSNLGGKWEERRRGIREAEKKMRR